MIFKLYLLFTLYSELNTKLVYHLYMKALFKIIITSFALTSLGLAQEAPATPASPTAAEAEIQTGPPTIEEIRKAFPSAVPAGATGKVGGNGEVKVHEGQIFLNSSDTAKLMESYGNLPASYDGAIVAIDESYVITFMFDAIGYVKDDEKEDLDSSEMLEVHKERQEQANEQRASQGVGSLDIEGWALEPKYNETTNNLEWALILRDEEGGKHVNHNIKVLGRKGVSNVTLICDPETLEALRPTLDMTLAGFNYTAGNKYSEFKEGDKVSEYGLKALIVGGGIFAAGKLGIFALLAKFWKAIVGGIVVVGAVIKSKLTGKKQQE